MLLDAHHLALIHSRTHFDIRRYHTWPDSCAPDVHSPRQALDIEKCTIRSLTSLVPMLIQPQDRIAACTVSQFNPTV